MSKRVKTDVNAFLRSRRSIRHFTPAIIPLEIINRILETATFAPSAHNLQPWRFVVLTDSLTKIHLAKAIVTKFRQDMVVDGIPSAEIEARAERTIRRSEEAPVIVVLCWDTSQVNSQPDASRQQAESLLGVQSVAMAGLQLLLAAQAEGIGASWICWPLYAPNETCSALGLAPEWEPQGMIFLGCPGEEPEIPKRKPLKDVSLWFSTT